MKRRWVALSVAVILGLGTALFLGHLSAGAQTGGEPGTWTFQGPEGGGADALAVSPEFSTDGVAFGGNVYYIRAVKTGLGLFKSTDGGQSWTLSATTLETDTVISGVDAVAFSPEFAVDQTVFAGASSGLFKSTDGGSTWQYTGVGGPPYGAEAVAVAPDYASSGHVMAVAGTSLHISENSGVTWTTKSGLGFLGALAYSPDFAADHTAFAGGEALWRTVNRGITWTQVMSDGVRALALSPNFAVDGTLFGGSLHGTFYVSTDTGASWITRTVAPTASTVNALAVSPAYVSDTTLFAGCHGGLFRSVDGGVTWAAVSSYPGLPVEALALSPDWPTDPTMLVGTPAGVYRTDDGGATWQRSGFTALEVNALVGARPAAQLFAGTYRQGLFQSADAGAQWSPAGLYGTPFIDVAAAPSYPADSTLFASVAAGAGMSFYRSDDGGMTWSVLRSGDHRGGYWAFSPEYATDGTVFVTEDGDVWRSTNRGVTVTQVGTWPAGVYDPAHFVLLSPDYPTEETLWAAGSGFWRLDPGATTWVSVTLPVPKAEFTDIARSPDFRCDQTLLATGHWREDGSHVHHSTILRSVDAGATWSTATLAFSDSMPLQAVAFSPRFAADQTAYVVSRDALYRSSDGGVHWVEVGAPPVDVTLRDVVAHGYGRVSVATDAGVWQYTTDWEQVVVNGGFEADDGWGYPETPLPAARTDVVTHTGAWAARIGVGAGSGVPTETAYSSVRQMLTVPRDALTATLRFYYYPQSTAVTTTTMASPTAVAAEAPLLENDLQYVMILETGEILFWDLVDADHWLSYTVDLSDYAGRSFTLHFGVANDGVDGYTGMYLDDVSLLTRRLRLSDLTEHVYLPLVLRGF